MPKSAISLPRNASSIGVPCTAWRSSTIIFAARPRSALSFSTMVVFRVVNIPTNIDPMATMILANATVSGERGYAQRISTTAGHELASDEPERRGGTNTGAAPFDLMLGSLGACTAITMRMYGDRKQWTLGAIEVKLRLVKEGDEPMRIERKISVSEAIDGEQQAKLLEIADKTPVTKALAPGVPIQTVFETSTQPAR